MRLDIRSNGKNTQPELAIKVKEGKKEKIEMNKRGIVLLSETDEGVDGETVNIRVGQCWKKGKEVIEIVGLGDQTAEVIIWEGKHMEVGRRVKVSKRNNYRGYPMGMGSRKVIKRTDIGMEGILVELSKDSVKGREMTCSIAAMRKRTLGLGEDMGKRSRRSKADKSTGEDDSNIEEPDTNEEVGWAKWKGRTIKKIYTDGSYKEEKTLKTLLLGGHRVKAGGGIVIQDEEGFFTPIRVVMDIEVDSAFPVETITLLTGCIIGGGKGKIEIGSDCLGAMAAVRKKNKNFSRILQNYEPGNDINIRKVKAHPERREEIWQDDEVGIYLADEVAGGGGGAAREILATTVLKHFGAMGSIAIVDNNNIPYIGNIMKRCSKEKMKKYYIKRDEYREDKGKRGMWEGTSSSLIYKMMGKTGSMEDSTAVNRIGTGKRWKMSRHNLEVCQACGEDSRSNNHALRKCRADTVNKMRKIWYDGVSRRIYRIKDRDLRGLVEDMWTKMKYRRGGEMAMCGCFQPRWVDLLMKGTMALHDGEDKTIVNILKIIGAGARELVKVYTEATGGAALGKNVRQTNILGFFARKGNGVDVNKNIIKYKGEIIRGKKRKGRKLESNKILRKGGYDILTDTDGFVKWKFKDR